MILIMPDNLSLERRQSMTAFGAELILVTKAQGMEGARDLAERMRAEGKGIDPRPVRQSRQSARALPHDGSGDLERHAGPHHALRLGDGHDRHDHGRVEVPQGEESGDHHRRCAAGGRRVDSRHPQVAARRTCRRSTMRGASTASSPSRSGGRGHDAPARARGRHLLRRVVGRRVRGRAAHRAEVRDATIVFVVCDRGDRYLSTGVFPGMTPDPRLRHRDHSRCRGHPPHLTTCRRDAGRRRGARVVRAEAPRRDRQRLRAALPAAGRRHRAARCARPTISRCGRSARLDDPEPELIRRFFDGIEKFTPQLVSWNGGGFDLPVLNHRALIHGVAAEKYWDWGDEDREFKFNNYLGRYHTRHLDLMDVLAMYQPRANAGLDAMARLCGFPGKLGMDGSEVAAPWRAASSPTCATTARRTSLNTLPRLPALPPDARRARRRASTRRRSRWCARASPRSDAPHWKAFLGGIGAAARGHVATRRRRFADAAIESPALPQREG